jgi:hypothetical protein
MNRRGLLLGLGASLIAAPAIVRPEWLMPVKAVPYKLVHLGIDFTDIEVRATTWGPALDCLRYAISKRGLVLHHEPPAIPDGLIARRIGPARVVDYYDGKSPDIRRRLDVFGRDYAA